MKLNEKKLNYLIREMGKRRPTKEIAFELKVSKRRVEQVWKEYRETGKVPVIGVNVGRPKKPRPNEERDVVKAAWERDRFGARMLETIICKRNKIRISHNRIHEYLLELGYASEMPKKKRSRKCKSYEREHTLSAIHMDWCEGGFGGTMVGAIIDDSSRKILSGGEYDAVNTENSKKIFDEMAVEYHGIRPARELIIDRGTEFGAHRARDNPDWESEFKAHVTAYGTKVILIRKRHPQSNGKIERWFETYYAHREAFASFEEFVKWYNDRPHGSLDFENIETPNEAFWRRLPPENLLGVASRMFGW